MQGSQAEMKVKIEEIERKQDEMKVRQVCLFIFCRFPYRPM
jgi:hypothetical protein